MADETELSPDGRYRIEYLVDEWFRGCWYRSPTLFDAATGDILFKSPTWKVDAKARWESDDCVVLEFIFDDLNRRVAILRLDLAGGTASLLAPTSDAVPLAAAAKLLSTRMKEVRAYVPAGTPPAAKAPSPAHVVNAQAGPDAAEIDNLDYEPTRPTPGFASDDMERRFTGKLMIAIGVGVLVIYGISLIMS